MEEKKLGAVIRQAREEKGLSQEKLAELVDVSRQAVSKWEKGLAVPTEDNLKRLEHALDLPEGTLMELTDAIDVPQDAVKPISAKHLAVFAAVAILIGVGGFFAGRATIPVPASTAAEPETKTIWRRTASYIDHPNPYDSEDRSTYDEMGRLVRRENLGSPADPTVRVNEFVYDEKGNQVEHLIYVDGELWKRQEYEYDGMGNQILSRDILADGTVEEWYEAAYDERGSQISYAQYNGDGKLLDSGRYTYTYYEDGSYEQDHFAPASPEDNNLAWHVVEHYDPYGNLLKQTEFDMSGNVTRTWTFEYQSFEVPIDFEPTV